MIQRRILVACACSIVFGCTADSPPFTVTYQPAKADIAIAPGWSVPQNIGSPINTAGWEDSVSIAPDGNALYFGYADYDFLQFLASGGKTRRTTGPDRGTHPNDLADIMVSYRDGGVWQTPHMVEALSEPFALDDGAFTPDGELLVHSGMRNDCVGGPGASDLFMSSWQGKAWARSTNIGRPVCSPASESNPWLSADGDTLLFDSDRAGGFGSRDLWMTERRDGQWQKPVNLGNLVNSEHEEVQPFVTYDRQELWFAGSARDGSDDHAIYMTKRNAEGQWSNPQVIIKGLVGEPTLTADNQQLFFVHIYQTSAGYNADIMCSHRKAAGLDQATEKPNAEPKH